MLVLAEDDCYISFGDSPEIVVAIISDVKAKLFHDRNASDVCNSVGYLSFKIFAKNVISILGLEVGNVTASITLAIQMPIAKVDFRRKSPVGELLEGRTAIQVRTSRVKACRLGDFGHGLWDVRRSTTK